VWNNNPVPTEVDAPRIHSGRNIGYGAACNRLAAMVDHEFIVLVNNDCFVHAGWWPPIVRAFQDPTVGIVGGQLFYPDGRVQHAGVGLRYRGGLLEAYNEQWNMAGTVDMPAVTGALMAVRRACWRELRGFDEAFYNGYEDVDLCLRARAAGWRVVYEHAAHATHLESASGSERWVKVRENVMLLQERWAGKAL